MKRAAILFVVLSLACSSSDLTKYNSPERARTVLTAVQTLRYHSAQEVAKAYVQGRITKPQADTFESIDNSFRAAWEVASELVRLWLVSGQRPVGLTESMGKVETLAAAIEAESRKVQ